MKRENGGAAPARPGPEVLAAFDLAPDSLAAATTGLINASWHARTLSGRRLILQRLNPIFSAEVNRDIAVITEHLTRKGIMVPQLVPTVFGALWFERGGEVWRAQGYIDGTIHAAVGSSERAAEAGRVLAEFHRGLSDLDHSFENARLGVHDTARHLKELRATLGDAADHPNIASVRPLAEEILERAVRLPELPDRPDRIVHGDPKINNILFDKSTDRGLCMIDLDTVARMPVVLELGDAFRSWCNPTTEDAADARFSLALFEAAARAYALAAGGWLTVPEWRAIPEATLTITLELAARFCADALHESYFGWDRERFPSSSEHQQARTRAQLSVAREIEAQLTSMQTLVEQAFAE